MAQRSHRADRFTDKRTDPADAHLCDVDHTRYELWRVKGDSVLRKKGKNILNFRFSDFEIDVARYELRRAEKIVPVEPQVFDLLVYLVRNGNRIVSKDELIDAVWLGRIVSEAAFSSRLSAARRALGDDGARQVFIRTHYKRGFSFIGKLEDQPTPADLLAAKPCSATVRARRGCDGAGYVRSDRPYVAVLPFRNISDDPAQERFASGLTEDLIIGLTRQPWFSVVTLNSHSVRGDETVDLRSVAHELGVRYAFEGSVRIAADRVRVTGRLIDAR